MAFLRACIYHGQVYYNHLRPGCLHLASYTAHSKRIFSIWKALPRTHCLQQKRICDYGFLRLSKNTSTFSLTHTNERCLMLRTCSSMQLQHIRSRFQNLEVTRIGPLSEGIQGNAMETGYILRYMNTTYRHTSMQDA